MAKEIYDNYIVEGSSRELNLSSTQKKAAKDSILGGKIIESCVFEDLLESIRLQLQNEKYTPWIALGEWKSIPFTQKTVSLPTFHTILSNHRLRMLFKLFLRAKGVDSYDDFWWDVENKSAHYEVLFEKYKSLIQNLPGEKGSQVKEAYESGDRSIELLLRAQRLVTREIEQNYYSDWIVSKKYEFVSFDPKVGSAAQRLHAYSFVGSVKLKGSIPKQSSLCDSVTLFSSEKEKVAASSEPLSLLSSSPQPNLVTSSNNTPSTPPADTINTPKQTTTNTTPPASTSAKSSPSPSPSATITSAPPSTPLRAESSEPKAIKSTSKVSSLSSLPQQNQRDDAKPHHHKSERTSSSSSSSSSSHSPSSKVSTTTSMKKSTSSFAPESTSKSKPAPPLPPHPASSVKERIEAFTHLSETAPVAVPAKQQDTQGQGQVAQQDAQHVHRTSRTHNRKRCSSVTSAVTFQYFMKETVSNDSAPNSRPLKISLTPEQTQNLQQKIAFFERK
eukprot:TRINITY_DN1097_c0_g1_i4.p1 TRINITY_DN1097_c0_g1~~TRINITY_DN1097_c0_g1_i4.p1  ORF type:complete len:502 (+),score=141.23 TRINITY_DN1097_c0_g1_i4:1229-2734(+)